MAQTVTNFFVLGSQTIRDVQAWLQPTSNASACPPTSLPLALTTCIRSPSCTSTQLPFFTVMATPKYAAQFLPSVASRPWCWYHQMNRAPSSYPCLPPVRLVT